MFWLSFRLFSWFSLRHGLASAMPSSPLAPMEAIGLHPYLLPPHSTRCTIYNGVTENTKQPATSRPDGHIEPFMECKASVKKKRRQWKQPKMISVCVQWYGNWKHAWRMRTTGVASKARAERTEYAKKRKTSQKWKKRMGKSGKNWCSNMWYGSIFWCC